MYQNGIDTDGFIVTLIPVTQSMISPSFSADDMGLGKTMSMISLVLHTKNERMIMENEEEEKYEEREAKYKKMCNAAGFVCNSFFEIIK